MGNILGLEWYGIVGTWLFSTKASTLGACFGQQAMITDLLNPDKLRFVNFYMHIGGLNDVHMLMVHMIGDLPCHVATWIAQAN